MLSLATSRSTKQSLSNFQHFVGIFIFTGQKFIFTGQKMKMLYVYWFAHIVKQTAFKRFSKIFLFVIEAKDSQMKWKIVLSNIVQNTVFHIRDTDYLINSWLYHIQTALKTSRQIQQRFNLPLKSLKTLKKDLFVHPEVGKLCLSNRLIVIFEKCFRASYMNFPLKIKGHCVNVVCKSPNIISSGHIVTNFW